MGFEVGLGLLGVDLVGAGERSFGVLGDRGDFGVGGSLLTKWHGRETFFLLSAGDCCSAGRRAGTGMRLGVPGRLAGTGLVGEFGDEGQSSDRLSSQGWAIVVVAHLGARPCRGTRTRGQNKGIRDGERHETNNKHGMRRVAEVNY